MELVKTEEAKKITSLKDALSGQDTTEQDDAALVAALLDDKGNLKVDTSLPAEYELEVMAKQLLDHLAAYAQNKQAWRAARNSNDHARAKSLFDQMQFNQLTAAIIQHSYPRAKALADELGKLLAKQTQANRTAQIGAETE